MPRRSNGEGSISRRKDGRFTLRITDPATGYRRQWYFSTGAEAERARRLFVTQAESGAVVFDLRGTVATIAEEWLSQRAGRRRADSTVREYRRRLEAYVLPHIGRKKLSALTVTDVEDVLDELANAGLSDSTIRGTRNALAAMLSDAVRARRLNTNVASLARLPEREAPRTSRRVPTPEEIARLIDVTAGSELGALVVLLAGTGARVGEALGSCWSDFDLDARRWHVARTVTRNSSGAPVLGRRTKTGETRDVYLTEDTVEELRAQRSRVAAQKLRLGGAWTDLDLVFPTVIGTVRDPNNVRRDLHKAAPWFPGAFHGLRHAFATAAISVLPSDAAVAKVLGHRKTATTTDLYGHLRGEDSRAVGEAVARQLFAARPR